MLSKIKNNVETIIFVVLAGIYLLASICWRWTLVLSMSIMGTGLSLGEKYSQEMATSSLMYD